MDNVEYVAVVVYDEENSWYFGSVTGKRDGFTFIGRSPKEVKEEFRVSFDDYLSFCIERGGTPDESFTGAMEADVVAAVHLAADAAAEPGGMTLNEWLGETAEQTTAQTV